MAFWDEGTLVYVSLADLSLTNGPGINEREFAIGLRRRFGERVSLIIPRPRQPLAEIRALNASCYAHPRRWNLPGYWRQQRELKQRLDAVLSSKQVSAVICRLSVLPWAIANLGHQRIPLFIKTQGEVSGIARNRGLKGLVAKSLAPLNTRLYRQVFRRAWGVDCCTEVLVRRLCEDFEISPERVQLVENATNVRRFRPGDVLEAKRRVGLDRFQKVLGFVGGAAGDRGGREILEALFRLRTDYPRLGAAIVGRDPDSRLARYARQLGVEDRVALPGLVPYEQVPDWVNSFDIAYALDAPGRFAQVGNSYQKVRQYLACGKPVITCVSSEDSFLVRERLAAAVPSGDLDSVERVTRELLAWDADQGRQQAARSVEYAGRWLSTDATLQQRLDFWQRRISLERPPRKAA